MRYVERIPGAMQETELVDGSKVRQRLYSPHSLRAGRERTKMPILDRKTDIILVQMNATLQNLGIFCILAAIVGGGCEALGFKLPLLHSVKRQVLLAGFGGILIISAHFSEAQALLESWLLPPALIGQDITFHPALSDPICTDHRIPKRVSVSVSLAGGFNGPWNSTGGPIDPGNGTHLTLVKVRGFGTHTPLKSVPWSGGVTVPAQQEDYEICVQAPDGTRDLAQSLRITVTDVRQQP